MVRQGSQTAHGDRISSLGAISAVLRDPMAKKAFKMIDLEPSVLCLSEDLKTRWDAKVNGCFTTRE